MSLPKARQAASQPRRRICRLCYNLDPRGHTSTVYHTESKKGATASLTLVLDALALQRTKAPSDGGCRFCAVLIRALDAFFEGWRRCRSRVTLDIKEKGSIKVGVDGEEWKGELVEIHAGSGRILFLYKPIAGWPHRPSALSTHASCPLYQGRTHTRK